MLLKQTAGRPTDSMPPASRLAAAGNRGRGRGRGRLVRSNRQPGGSNLGQTAHTMDTSITAAAQATSTAVGADMSDTQPFEHSHGALAKRKRSSLLASAVGDAATVGNKLVASRSVTTNTPAPDKFCQQQGGFVAEAKNAKLHSELSRTIGAAGDVPVCTPMHMEAPSHQADANLCLVPGMVVWAVFGQAAMWPAQLVRTGPQAGKATVKLFGNGLTTDVDAATLTGFEQDCSARCVKLHSGLGHKVGTELT